MLRYLFAGQCSASDIRVRETAMTVEILTVSVVVLVFVVVVGDVDILVVELVFRLPGHLVLLLQSASGVREPGAHLLREEQLLKMIPQMFCLLYQIKDTTVI